MDSFKSNKYNCDLKYLVKHLTSITYIKYTNRYMYIYIYNLKRVINK